jgi:hypothetical protein
MALILATAPGLSGCCDVQDFAGDFTAAVTNRENPCGLMNWTEGDTSTNIPLTITQDGSRVVGIIGGLAGGYLDIVLGARDFTGDAGCGQMDMTLIGTNAYRQVDCTYTITVDAQATLVGDAMTGSLIYRPVTNHHASCGTLETCRNRQDFNGTRPPR